LYYPDPQDGVHVFHFFVDDTIAEDEEEESEEFSITNKIYLNFSMNNEEFYPSENFIFHISAALITWMQQVVAIDSKSIST
jgi:hypothetical protein